jgi:hypothetical protein
MIDAFKMLKAFFEFLTAAFKGGFLAVSNRIHFIYDCLGEVVTNEPFGVQRAIVLRVHNGGGNLSASKPTYVSVLYEESRSPLGHIRKDHQNVPADKHMMSMLQEVKLNGQIELKTDQLPPSYLKNFYLSQGVNKARLFFIKEAKGGFLWRQTKELHILSVSTVEEQVSFDAPALAESLTRLASNIKRNL